jgi:hypothetical protein
MVYNGTQLLGEVVFVLVEGTLQITETASGSSPPSARGGVESNKEYI